VSRKRNTRYPHAFSKGRGVAMVSQGSWRVGVGPRSPCIIQTQALGVASVSKPPSGGGKMSASKQQSGDATPAFRPQTGSAKAMPLYPIALDPRRWKVLRVSPTIANLYKSSAGVAVICADCLHGKGHRNPGLPDYFRRQWHLTLLEIEKKCRCEMCGSRNARVYPWWGNDGGELGLEGPPNGGR
jgi:hypothetical protein